MSRRREVVNAVVNSSHLFGVNWGNLTATRPRNSRRIIITFHVSAYRQPIVGVVDVASPVVAVSLVAMRDACVEI